MTAAMDALDALEPLMEQVLYQEPNNHLQELAWVRARTHALFHVRLRMHTVAAGQHTVAAGQHERPPLGLYEGMDLYISPVSRR